MSTSGRQGDVLVVRIDALPKGAKQIKNHTLALGEATGHHHVIADTAEVYADVSDLYFVVAPKFEAPLTHEEHGTIVFGEGIYKVIRQVEYDGEDERRVRD